MKNHVFKGMKFPLEENTFSVFLDITSNGKSEKVNKKYSSILGFRDTPQNLTDSMNTSLDKQVKNSDEDAIFYEYVGDLGGAIQSIMNMFELNMTTVARRANIQVSYLSMIISNQRIPHTKKLASIAKALNDIPLSYIFLKAKLLDKSKNESQMTLGEKQGMILEPVLTKMLQRIYGEAVEIPE